VTLGIHVSATFIGNSLVDDLLLRHASVFGGIYALSLLAIMVNVALLHIARGHLKPQIGVTALLVSLVAWNAGQFMFSFAPTPIETVRVAAATTQIKPTLDLQRETYDVS
jgi:apolipoprotein N-acyltransferase